MAEHPIVAWLEAALNRADLAAQGFGSDAQTDVVMACGPAALLRRVAADRQILAEHQPEPGDAYDHVCRSCRTPEPGWADGVPAEWPCRTLHLLAEAYGWTEDSS